MAEKSLNNKGSTAVEVYKSLDAAPEDWDSARYWLINELRRIQNGFFSVDEVISQIESNKETPEPGEQGAQGPQGPQGPQGDPGEPGNQGPPGQDINASDILNDSITSLSFGWSSQKIQATIADALFDVGVGGDNSISIGGSSPAFPDTGDLWFDNTYTLELYLWNGSAWISTTGSSSSAGDQFLDGGSAATVYTTDQAVDGGGA